MRYLIRTRYALLAALVTLTACATRGQVEEIVAESNAALVSPYVDIAERDQASWEQSFADIERFIEAHPDNATLVNQLRVRQAMLLTVNGRRNLANQYWGLVERDALDSGRDRALADVGEELSWWYVAAPTTPDPIDEDEANEARAALNATIPTTPEDSDIRIYLSTIRAQLELRMVVDTRLSPPQTALPDALERYIDDIGADADWIEGLEDLDSEELRSARQIRAYRYRIWLNEMIEAYKETARREGLSLEWRPAWVNGTD